MKGFKDLVMRGNLVELAVAFSRAAAFAALVNTFTNWLLLLIPAGPPNSGTPTSGLFLTALVSFLVIAAVVYFSLSVVEKLRRVSESRRPRLRIPTRSCCLRDPRPARLSSRRRRLTLRRRLSGHSTMRVPEKAGLQLDR
jgi:large-conductance mechanosensitive channel